MQLITKSFEEELIATVSGTKKSITIVTPYITVPAVKKLIQCLPEGITQRRLVTLPPGKEYVDGATEADALLLMKEAGFDIRMLERLHAKIYCLDEALYVGSANFTSKGLGLTEDGNREIMVKLPFTRECKDQIEEAYWDEAARTNITSIWIAEIKQFIGSLNIDIKSQLLNIDSEMKKRFPPLSPYVEILVRLQEKNIIKKFEHQTAWSVHHLYKINNRKIVKVLRSKTGTMAVKSFDQVFNYQIQEKTAELIKDGKIKAILLILEEPDTYVCLPSDLLNKKVLLKKYKLRNKDWQFKIKRASQRLVLTIKGKGPLTKYEITEYGNGKLVYTMEEKKA